MFVLNVAVTTLLASIVNCAGLAAPLRSPDQPAKYQFVSGMAVSVRALRFM